MKRSILRSRQGFTLAELLIATAITGLIIVLLGQIFSTASAMWRSGGERIDAFRDARAALQLMAADLARANINGDPQMLKLDQIQSSADGSYTYAGEADAITLSKNAGKSDLCTVEYYLLWNDTTKTFSLMRLFRNSDATNGQVDKKGNTPTCTNGLTSPLNLTCLFTKKLTNQDEAQEVLAAPIWDLQIRPGTSDIPLTSVTPASTSWKWLEIHFKSMSVNSARKLKGMTSISQSTWTNPSSTQYKSLILPYEQQFVTRVALEQNR
jgi:prepilin-type N-terminal cleavage/methylation domain-containing protein